MFIGHAAVALAAKKLAPEVSLGVLLAAATWLDLVWPVLVLLGIETVRIDPGNTAFTPLDFVSYPWTHSLLLALAWSVLFGLAARPWVRTRRACVVLGALVFSHWLLDFVTHRPDLPVAPGESAKLGLGLWNSVPATLAVEGALMAMGLWLYLRTTAARGAAGRYAFWGLVVFYVAIWLANLASPPPPSDRAVAWVGLAGWLLPLWAGWADRGPFTTRRAASP
ncbi:MAG TPA: hypothetical protein VFM98_04835 [Ramlibacter sp.]|uniref:hypothetical protein n=1 Tax=Ramlibacter sp. TaxID=1917967 RepID=UPI002D7E35E6|nr:hypothetical protein [Ramlibacter sp.]HET8744904.1 hypothetical protein [Ramlibacter sp.]